MHPAILKRSKGEGSLLIYRRTANRAAMPIFRTTVVGFGVAAALDVGLKIVLESVSASTPLTNHGKN